MPAIKRERHIATDVVVIGGGLAGISAAVSAARNGAQVVLVQDRPVLGGNSSSEIRVHVNGVTHLKDGQPERETGPIEEMLLLNRFRNPAEAFTVWDHVLYEYVTNEPNIDLMLNTQAIEAQTEGDRIKSIRCWQLTTETEITVTAPLFIDCSGDGIIAASAGADFRQGREASSEFNEKYAPAEADGWCLGSSIVFSAVDTGKPAPYEPPPYAIPYEADKSHPGRKIVPFANGIWWVELGSEIDIIGESEDLRHKLMGHMHGVWDYIKNSGKVKGTENYALSWIGSLPGKRESRRFMGDYILNECDLLETRHFEDAVGFGGWSLDEHCPGGIENLAEPPSYFHERFDRVYEIPFRSLYSRNVPNLLFAGRNFSATHIALSSTRVMGTCATMGQAVGTASALCLQKNITPRELANTCPNDLQEQLLRDDAFIPRRPAQAPGDLARTATLSTSDTGSGDVALLTDGHGRDFEGEIHHWASDGLPATVTLTWDAPVTLSQMELKCDTNLKRNILMHKASPNEGIFRNDVPTEMLKALHVEALVDGEWLGVGDLDNNKTRLIKFAFDAVDTASVRLVLVQTYGTPYVKLFEVRCY